MNIIGPSLCEAQNWWLLKVFMHPTPAQIHLQHRNQSKSVDRKIEKDFSHSSMYKVCRVLVSLVSV